MSKSSSPPPAPDYRGAAEETAESNMDMLQFSTEANRYDEVTPWGTTSWERPEAVIDQAGFDEATAAWEDEWFRSDAYEDALRRYDNMMNDDRFSNVPEVHRSDYIRPSAPDAPDIDDYTTQSNDWTRTMTLSPEAQSAINNALGVQSRQSDLAISGMDSVENMFSEDFDWSQFGDAPTWENIGEYTGVEGEMPTYGEHRDNQLGIMFDRINEDHTNLLQDKEAELSARGIPVGSDRWNEEMQNLYDSRTRARSGAELDVEKLASLGYMSALSGRQQQQSEALDLFRNNMTVDETNFARNTEARRGLIEEALLARQMPLNEVNAFMSGSQVDMPQFSPVAPVGTAPGTDYLTAMMNQGQYDTDVYNAGVAQDNAMWNAGGSMASAYMMYLLASDERLKHNIERIGTQKNGLPRYEFSYLGSDYRHKGVMAQDVMKVMPEAVVRADDGYLMVDTRVIE